jgi:hypothetical protein
MTIHCRRLRSIGASERPLLPTTATAYLIAILNGELPTGAVKMLIPKDLYPT